MSGGAMSTQRGDINVFIRWEDFTVGLQAENVSWSPDVAVDMIARVKTLFNDTLESAWQFGLIQDSTDDVILVDEKDGDDNG